MRYRLGAFLIILVSALGVAWIVSNTALERILTDWRLRYVLHQKIDPRIVIAGVNEEVFDKKLYNRQTHARILENLRAAGCLLVAYDILFDEDRDPAVDAAFAKAMREAPACVVAGSETVTPDGEVIPPHLAPHLQPVLKLGRVELGEIEKPRLDGSLTNYFLAMSYGRETVPSLALAAYALLHSVRAGDIRYAPDAVDVPPDKIPVIKSVDEGKGVTVYGFDLTFHSPATGQGHHPGPGTYPVIPYLRLLDPDAGLRKQLAGAIVFVGENTASVEDVVQTPVGPMKGVEAHAQCLNSLLSKGYYRSAGHRTNWACAATLTVLVAILSLGTWTLLPIALVGLSLLAACSALNLYLLAHLQIMLNLSVPLAGGLTALLCICFLRLVLLSRFLARFVPAEAAQGLLSDRAIAKAVRATVIVTDIRGYTTLSESRTPVEMLKLLNEYHSVTVDIYQKYGGNVLTFQGDAQLVVFGFPRKLQDPVGQAVRASVEVMQAIDLLRAKWGIHSRSNFDVGAGICTGMVYVGDIGSREQANYTVIGEVVRTSHKVQSMSTALEGNVLMDEPSFRSSRSKLNVTAIPNVQLEGFPAPKTLYRVES